MVLSRLTLPLSKGIFGSHWWAATGLLPCVLYPARSDEALEAEGCSCPHVGRPELATQARGGLIPSIGSAHRIFITYHISALTTPVRLRGTTRSSSASSPFLLGFISPTCVLGTCKAGIQDSDILAYRLIIIKLLKMESNRCSTSNIHGGGDV